MLILIFEGKEVLWHRVININSLTHGPVFVYTFRIHEYVSFLRYITLANITLRIKRPYGVKVAKVYRLNVEQAEKHIHSQPQKKTQKTGRAVNKS